MRKLILVRHSLPEFTEGVPAHQWSLSAEGRQRCVPLAEGLGAYEPVAVVTSTEPKAVETGQVIADHLSLLLESADGLREHHRSQPVVLDAETPFEARVAELFARPGELVLGDETGHQAHARFSAAVESAMARHPEGDVLVVAHGTVIALYVSRAAGIDPFPFWTRLGMPGYAVLSWPERELVEEG